MDTCIVLAGGLGTRLSHLLDGKPKCLAPIGDRSFLEILLESLYIRGISNFILALGYKSDLVLSEINSSWARKYTISYNIEKEPLLTGGAIKNVLESFQLDESLVVNGDTLISGDIIRKHNLRYDEHMMTVPNACINLQLLDLGYENWRTELTYTHHHTPGDKSGTPKWEHADIPIDMKKGDCQIYLKYNGCGNDKIQEWVDMDTNKARDWLISVGRDKEDYRSFEL